ncbi:MAG: DUF4162 domain-containing protein [Bacteroidales bacterium]|nr:DUF4162 domain-containing protein [Bacteroidales bacterium]
MPQGKNAELISEVMKQTDLLSYREVLPSMNEIFIKTVKSNE